MNEEATKSALRIIHVVAQPLQRIHVVVAIEAIPLARETLIVNDFVEVRSVEVEVTMGVGEFEAFSQLQAIDAGGPVGARDVLIDVIEADMLKLHSSIVAIVFAAELPFRSCEIMLVVVSDAKGLAAPTLAFRPLNQLPALREMLLHAILGHLEVVFGQLVDRVQFGFRDLPPIPVVPDRATCHLRDLEPAREEGADLEYADVDSHWRLNVHRGSAFDQHCVIVVVLCTRMKTVSERHTLCWRRRTVADVVRRCLNEQVEWLASALLNSFSNTAYARPRGYCKHVAFNNGMENSPNQRSWSRDRCELSQEES